MACGLPWAAAADTGAAGGAVDGIGVARRRDVSAKLPACLRLTLNWKRFRRLHEPPGLPLH